MLYIWYILRMSHHRNDKNTDTIVLESHKQLTKVKSLLNSLINLNSQTKQEINTLKKKNNEANKLLIKIDGNGDHHGNNIPFNDEYINDANVKESPMNRNKYVKPKEQYYAPVLSPTGNPVMIPKGSKRVNSNGNDNKNDDMPGKITINEIYQQDIKQQNQEHINIERKQRRKIIGLQRQLEAEKLKVMELETLRAQLKQKYVQYVSMFAKNMDIFGYK